MDTTEQYIKMCEKAEEIQTLRFPDFFAGDWYISLNGYPMVIGSVLPLDEDLHRRGEIWLPRQDQLQEMIWTKGNAPLLFLRDFLHFVGKERKYEASFEQLWLAFVMKEKYNKTWDGNKWTTN